MMKKEFGLDWIRKNLVTLLKFTALNFPKSVPVFEGQEMVTLGYTLSLRFSSRLVAVPKVRHAIFKYFGPILTLHPSVTLCHTSWDPPKVRHTSRTPNF